MLLLIFVVCLSLFFIFIFQIYYRMNIDRSSVIDHSSGGTASALNTSIYVYIAAESTLGLFTIITNTLVLVVLCRFRTLHTVANCYIGSLAVADVMVGFFSPVLIVVAYLDLARDFYSCVFIHSFVRVFLNTSLLSLACLTLDRYWSILYPVSRFNVASIRCAFINVAVLWILGTSTGLMPLMGWHKDPEGFKACSYLRVIDLRHTVYIRFFALELPLILTMLFVNARIFYSVVSGNKRRAGAMLRDVPLGMSREARLKSQKKLLLALTMIFVLFAVCWLPLDIINCIIFWDPDTVVDKDLLFFTVFLSHFNSLVNPIVYAVSQPGFRRIIRTYIRACGPEDIVVSPSR